MQIRERFFRHVVTNVVLGLAVFAVFVVVYSTATSPARANPEGAIYRGESTSKVSLMFNVYRGTEYLDDILSALDTAKVSATFFVGGSWVSGNEETLKKISYYGHEIGNHGYFEKDHSRLNAERNREEIFVTHKLIAAILNVEMNLFAPPAGSFGKATIDEATKLGYKTILWTIDSGDLRDQDTQQIVKRATTNLTAGSFVLLHPTAATATALPQIIAAIQAQGLEIATVSETLLA